MKSFTIASAFLAAAAVAQPHGNHHRRHHEHQQDKRAMVTEIEWVTETAYVTKLIDSTTTVWVTPGQEQPTTTSTSTTEQANFIETSASPIQKKKTSTTEEYVAPEPTTTSIYVPPTTSTTLSTSTTSTSEVYVPPVESSTSVYVAPEPTTTSVYVAPIPTTTSEVYVAPTTTAEVVVATTSAVTEQGSSSGGSASYSGEITYYDLGQNACGGDAGGEDYSTNLVAISHVIMGDGPTLASNPYCGKTITITANGKSCSATVRDKCMGCAEGDIDVSKKIFTELFGGLDQGRVDGISWHFN